MHLRFNFKRTLQASAYLLRYRHLGDFELSELIDEFPEWGNHYSEGGSSPIPWQDMLAAQNKAEMVAIVERDETARQVFDDFFGPEP